MTSLGVLERTGEEGGGGGGEGVEGVTRRRGGAEGGAGWLKFLFFFSAFSAAPREIQVPTDGVEIHEPALEQRARHRLQPRVHPPVQLDLTYPLVRCNRLVKHRW